MINQLLLLFGNPQILKGVDRGTILHILDYLGFG